MKTLIILLIPMFALAQPSENFILTKSVIDAGGGVATSENFGLTSAFGQPTPIGAQTSENFALLAGFLHPQFGVSPLSPIQALVIKEIQPGVKLWWETISGAATYSVYRDSVSTFTPGPGNLLGATSDTTFTDANAVLLPDEKLFYIVTSSDP